MNSLHLSLPATRFYPWTTFDSPFSSYTHISNSNNLSTSHSTNRSSLLQLIFYSLDLHLLTTISKLFLSQQYQRQLVKMVQGLPAVDWKNADNNTKLFAAVLASCGNLNNSKIAEVFGPHVPGSAISYRLNVIRKDGAALGVTAGAGSITTSIKANGTKKRATPATKQNKPKGKGRKLGGFLNDGQSDDTKSAVDDGSEGMVSFAETEDENASTTPAPKRQKTLSGRVTKRVSPRKGQKTDYKKLDDPFVTMANAEDDDGENIFGAPSATNSEDTYATDGSFEDKEAGVDAGEKAVIKMEEAY